jgi:hypothetical protein
MEPDFTTVMLSPTNLVWERVWSSFCDVQVAGGWDPRYGARLHADLQAIGLMEVHSEYFTTRHPGGTPHTRLLSLTVERLRERMIASGATDDEINEARRLLADPANTISTPTTCIARGRRA